VREAKAKTKRQMAEDARRAALEGRWDEVIALNNQIVERSPRDAVAHNRLGRALLELGRQGGAIEAYSTALRADPANMIARRNLQRLETLGYRPGSDEAPPVVGAEEDGTEENGGASDYIAATVMPRTNVFIEEVGKTWVDELVNAVPMDHLANVLPGVQLGLEIDGRRVYVSAEDGTRLGEIEAKSAERVIDLTQNGNRYEVYALGLSPTSLRVILREVYRDPSQAMTISFPRQIKTRAYLRERDLLRQRDEADFFLLDDDDDEDDEGTNAEASDDDDAAEPDAEPFVEDTVATDEEEQTLA